MVNESELPSSPIERAALLESLMTERATGNRDASSPHYEYLRREFMTDPATKELLPPFVRTSRTLDVFWPYIKNVAGNYADRRRFVSEGFAPLAEHLEGRNKAPGDAVVSPALQSFDAEGVHVVWMKALERRTTDPEGAITIARTLLETVCKRILDQTGSEYDDKEDLPKLYSLAAKALNLAPDQQSEEPIKALLRGAVTLVNGIGTLRNKLSDAHGRGGSRPVKASPRHASLAVNLAGGMATFLVETFHTRQPLE
jgi:Abortive infection C-terminus